MIETSDGPITITFIDNKCRDRIRLGIDAPVKCLVLRGELIASKPAQEG